MKKGIARAIYISTFLFLIGCISLTRFAQPTPTSIPLSSTSTVTLTPSATPTSTSTPAPIPTGVTNPIFLTPLPALTDLYAFIQAPGGPLVKPYVILTGFQSAADEPIEIRGVINGIEFVCSGSPCALPLQTSSNVTFAAYSAGGNTSNSVTASVRIEFRDDGYYVFLDSVSQFATFFDACLRFWNVKGDTTAQWAEFSQYPYLLNTNKTLHFLAARLINNGLVDVQGCTSGGLDPGLNWPTGCGIERSRNQMIEWQNKYDEYIWLASREVGIPPKIIKSLIEIESQFWPANELVFLDEIGLGQVNQLGVDVLLRRDSQIYQQACSMVQTDCGLPYALQPEERKALIRGALIGANNAACPSCEYGIDLNIAKESVMLIARMLKANCEQVKILVDAYQDEELVDDVVDPYTDLWKFTILSYHSGLTCFEQGLKNVAKANEPMDWVHLSERLDCQSGQGYVDRFWGNLLAFDRYRYTVRDMELVKVVPVFKPTNTPPPSPTPAISSARVQVLVYLDRNLNGVADDGEWLDRIPLSLVAENGVELTGTSLDGKFIFDLSGLPTGIRATISLPGLFRSETFVIPSHGVVVIEFRFDQPVLPTAIP